MCVCHRGDNTVHAFVCVLGWVAHTCVRVCHLSLDKCWTVGGVGGGSGGWGWVEGLSARMLLLLKWNNISLKAYAPRQAQAPYIKPKSVWWICSRPINLPPVPSLHPAPYPTNLPVLFSPSPVVLHCAPSFPLPPPPLALGCYLSQSLVHLPMYPLPSSLFSSFCPSLATLYYLLVIFS